MVILNRLLPTDSPKRVGKMEPRFITIHETSLGLELQPASKNYKHYYDILRKDKSTVGYHFLVEANISCEPKIYQFLETKVATDHTGTRRGNAQSIGIERLVNINTNMETAINTQARLTATLMHMYNIPISYVTPHENWSGKHCPARLLAGMYGGWDGFIEKVQYYFESQDFIEGVL